MTPGLVVPCRDSLPEYEQAQTADAFFPGVSWCLTNIEASVSTVLTLVEHRVQLDRMPRLLSFWRKGKTTEVFLDFVIDGKPLRTWIQGWESADRPPEELSLLTPSRPKLAIEQIDRLLGRLPHQYWDRGWLLFCGGCWDESCGGVTVDIRREKGTVHWDGIGWDDSYSADTYRIKNAVDFAFDEQEYDRVLLEARKHSARKRKSRWTGSISETGT